VINWLRMGRPAKTQWDFGELFPVEQTRRVISVTELTAQIRRLLEKEMVAVRVTGEITNLRAQTSGHLYFTLKDAGAQLSCVLFRSEVQVNRGLLQEGRKVILEGQITVYEPRGQYQLRVTSAELQGLGALQAAFERLKQKLKTEGLFAQERKRPLPRYPQRIGLVTSPNGAAIRDVLHVVQRRNPGLEMILASCRVQGQGAAEEIAAGIRLLNEFNRSTIAPHARTAGALRSYLDLILVTRGGGSLEDLWAFNEEIVARAIFESELPIVSAVGHEIDFTISDFVADVRAATPSAAAEIITEGVYSSCQFVAAVNQRIGELAKQRLTTKRQEQMRTTQRLSRLHPRRRLNEQLQHLDELQLSLRRSVSNSTRQRRLTFRQLSERLIRLSPEKLVRQRLETVKQVHQRLRERGRARIAQSTDRIKGLRDRLRLLGPEQVLARGYSITFDEASGVILRQAADTKSGQQLRTRLQGGEVRSRVD
jgi:exodeoxyribonuclease VII large subunit